MHLNTEVETWKILGVVVWRHGLFRPRKIAWKFRWSWVAYTKEKFNCQITQSFVKKKCILLDWITASKRHFIKFPCFQIICDIFSLWVIFPPLLVIKLNKFGLREEFERSSINNWFISNYIVIWANWVFKKFFIGL